MTRPFQTAAGQPVPAVTSEQMRAVDRVAVGEVGLQLLQMMENAGRAIAHHARDVADDGILVVAGNGGNGGGGLAGARHLANRGAAVEVLLDRPPAALTGAAATQYRVLAKMDVPVTDDPDRVSWGGTVVDALVGYGIGGDLRQPQRGYVERTNDRAAATVSLDVPSGLDATTGEAMGAVVDPDRTVTLALPKTGLTTVDGRLVLADIAIPATVYERLDIPYGRPFGDDDWVDLRMREA